jgi:hypothetical protein
MRMHHDAALWGFAVLNFAGFLGWLALWQMRRRGHPPRAIIAATTAVLAVAIAMMAGAANLGGEIRHVEIRSGAAVAEVEGTDPADVFVTAAISRFVINSPWGSPAGETVHFLGMSLSIGVLLAVNLRILGVMRQVRFTHIHRLLPWGMLGFGANLITGMMFLIGTPAQYVTNVPFYWKVGLLMVAGANYLYLTVARSIWTGDELRCDCQQRLTRIGLKRSGRAIRRDVSAVTCTTIWQRSAVCGRRYCGRRYCGRRPCRRHRFAQEGRPHGGLQQECLRGGGRSS